MRRCGSARAIRALVAILPGDCSSVSQRRVLALIIFGVLTASSCVVLIPAFKCQTLDFGLIPVYPWAINSLTPMGAYMRPTF